MNFPNQTPPSTEEHQGAFRTCDAPLVQSELIGHCDVWVYPRDRGLGWWRVKAGTHRAKHHTQWQGAHITWSGKHVAM